MYYSREMEDNINSKYSKGVLKFSLALQTSLLGFQLCSTDQKRQRITSDSSLLVDSIQFKINEKAIFACLQDNWLESNIKVSKE